LRNLVFVLLLLLSATSWAGLAGDWLGFGTWKFKGEGEGLSCSPMKMQWSEISNTIAIEGGYFDCAVLAMELGQTKWIIKDGHLLDADEKEVGTYDGKNFEVYMPSPADNTTIYIKVKRDANHLDYQEVWFNSVEKVYVIEARLFSSGK